MEAKPTTDGKTAMDAFTKTMKALFKVPKSEVQESAESAKKAATKQEKANR